MLNKLTKDEVTLFINDGNKVKPEVVTEVINNLSVSDSYIFKALQNIHDDISETADNIVNLRAEVTGKLYELEEYESHLEKSREELKKLTNFWLISTKPSN